MAKKIKNLKSKLLKDKITITEDKDTLHINLECKTTKALTDALKKVNPCFNVKEDLIENRDIVYDFIDELNDSYINSIQECMNWNSAFECNRRNQKYNEKANSEQIKNI